MRQLMYVISAFVFYICIWSHADDMQNGTVFSSRLHVPSFAANSLLPKPAELLDPLEASRRAHWRCRYENGMLREVCRTDSDGTLRPMQPPQSPISSHGILFHYTDGLRRPNVLVTPLNDVFLITYNNAGYVSAMECTNNMPKTTRWTHLRIERDSDNDMQTISYWYKNTPAEDVTGVHMRHFGYDENGYITEIWYTNPEGEKCSDICGIGRRTYTRGPRGEWYTISYFDAQSRPITDWYGVHTYVLSYTSRGLYDTLHAYTQDGQLWTNAFGATHMKWHYSPEGKVQHITATRGSETNTLIKYEGPPPVPPHFHRTFPDALLMREQKEFSIPCVSFLDYSALARAAATWNSHLEHTLEPVPADIEIARTLIEYVMHEKADTFALAVAARVAPLGYTDPRITECVATRSVVFPAPQSDAGKWYTRILLNCMPSGSVCVVANTRIHALLSYSLAHSNRQYNRTVFPLYGLTDTLWLQLSRATWKDSFRFPSLHDIRKGLSDVARTLPPKALSGINKDAVSLHAQHINITSRDLVAALTRYVRNVFQNENSFDANRLLVYEPPRFRDFSFSKATPFPPLFCLNSTASFAYTPAQLQELIVYWQNIVHTCHENDNTPDWNSVQNEIALLCAQHAATVAMNTDTSMWADILFQYAHECAPDNSVSREMYIEVLLALGKYSNAIAHANTLYASFPASKTVYELRERCIEQFNIATNIAFIQKHIENTTACTFNTRKKLIYTLWNAGQLSNAHTAAVTALKTCSTNESALVWLRNFFIAYDDTNAVMICAKKLTHASPKSYDYWLQRATLSLQHRNEDDVLFSFQHAAGIDYDAFNKMVIQEKLVTSFETLGFTNIAHWLSHSIKTQQVDRVLSPAQ